MLMVLLYGAFEVSTKTVSEYEIEFILVFSFGRQHLLAICLKDTQRLHLYSAQRIQVLGLGT